MKNLSYFFALALFIGASSFAITPPEIISNADAIRNPSQNFHLKVAVTSTDTDDQSIFDVSIQGNTRTLIRTLSPARDKGRNMLMLEEDMWSYLPTLKRAVRVSLSQKLTGQAANGDISRMRWAEDYEATLTQETPKEWVLHLKGKKKGLTYDQLDVWVEKDSFRPLKANYLSVTGQTLKEASYLDYKLMAGKQRPTKIVIQDAIKKSASSILTILEMESRDFPQSLFTQGNLSRSE